MSDPVRWAKGKASVVLKVPRIARAIRGVPLPTLDSEETQRAIAAAVVTGGKFVARVGSNEGDVVSHYLLHRLASPRPQPYSDHIRQAIKFGAGFFPADDASLDRLARLYLRHIEKIDIYAAWSKFDRYIYPLGAQICRLVDLDPFFTHNRWPRAVEGKRVSVVHPFTSTIERQLPRLGDLFDGPMWADCTFTLIQAPQTQVDAQTAGQDWFANLAAMEARIADSYPDICIVGAGAYGLPLAGHAHLLGATALMLGGATQLLFGIVGSRWLNDPQYRALVNAHWVRPGSDERPEGFENLEIKGGAYW